MNRALECFESIVNAADGCYSQKSMSNDSKFTMSQ